MPDADRHPSRSTLLGLDGACFFLADMNTGISPFVAAYLGSLGWNPGRIGVALTVGSAASIAGQTPMGAFVDHVRAKRAVLAAAVGLMAVGVVALAAAPRFWVVVICEAVLGGVSTAFTPAITALTLGTVGHAGLDRRTGRNQTFGSAGNVASAVAMGVTAHFVSDRAAFLALVVLLLATWAALPLIRPGEIDHDLARSGGRGDRAAGVFTLLRDRPLAVLLGCTVLYFTANAALLPLAGERVAHGDPARALPFMAECIVVTQASIAVVAAVAGRAAGRFGRKPVIVVAFAALLVRAVLYLMTANRMALIAIQAVEGVQLGTLVVTSILVVADRTRGTGRYNLAQSAVAAAVGVGATLSQAAGGAVARHAGYRGGFAFLSAVAAVALAAVVTFLPETKRD